MKIEPLIQMPTAWTGISERFGLHLFEGHVTVEDMDHMQVQGDRWHKRHPGKLVELVVVHPSDSRMTSEERQRMGRLIKHWEKDRVASATVILADGMLGAMQRSVLTGLLMIAPPPHPSKVFSAVPPAVDWLFPHAAPLLGGATRSHLLAAIDDWCVAFKARAPRPSVSAR